MTNRKLLEETSDKLATDAVQDINCHKFFDQYKTCIEKN
jgi:hypothetical protein